MKPLEQLEAEGFYIARNVIPQANLDLIKSDITDLAESLNIRHSSNSYHEIWNNAVSESRAKGSLIYNAVKRLPSVLNLPNQGVLDFAKENLGVRIPALVDVNFRIDAPQEGQFAFDWHQDYWFSVCSPMALVAWTPLVATDEKVGGVDVIPQSDKNAKIYRTIRNPEYKSYSNSILLDEPVPNIKIVSPQVNPGDCLYFRFHLLHRSIPNTSDNMQRWTIQSRIADFSDLEFKSHEYKPGIVSKEFISYLDGKKS
jgi:hypothetical protein